LSEISLTGDQMLSVLECVARRGPITAAELAAVIGINRTVAYRLLTTLNNRSYITRAAEGYVLGPAVTELLSESPGALRELAAPIMRDLTARTGETSLLHELDGDESVVSEQIVGEKHFLRVQMTLGSRFPLIKAAGGLAILAYQPPAKITRILSKAGGEVTTEDLAQVREQGFARSQNVLQSGVHGIGVPIHTRDGRVQAALVLVVPEGRNCGLSTLVTALNEARARLEDMIGLK
jgi:IclR family KDG regulon transcriptional repressor